MLIQNYYFEIRCFKGWSVNFYTIYPSEYIDREFYFDLKGKKEIIVNYFKFDLSDNFLKKSQNKFRL